jgi:hypothetical protein
MRYTYKVLRYTKTIVVLVKCLKVVAKYYSQWNLFMVPSIISSTHIKNIKMRSLKHVIKNIVKKVMAKYGFGHRFHDLKYFEVGFLFHIPCVHYMLEGSNTKIC